MISVEGINTWLKDNRGLNPFGQPLYKVVWSSSLTERRFGKFTDYSNGLFLRQVEEVRDVPKYKWKPDRWVLERWCEGTGRKELDDSRGTYEPVFFFEDKLNNPLPVTLKSVDFLTTAAEMQKMTKDDYEKLDEKLRLCERDEFKEIFNSVRNGLVI